MMFDCSNHLPLILSLNHDFESCNALSILVKFMGISEQPTSSCVFEVHG